MRIGIWSDFNSLRYNFALWTEPKVELQYWKFLNFSFILYCYENNSLSYFYCNRLESCIQISYRGVSYRKKS